MLGMQADDQQQSYDEKAQYMRALHEDCERNQRAIVTEKEREINGSKGNEEAIEDGASVVRHLE